MVEVAVLYSVELRLAVSQGAEPGQVTGYHLYAFFLSLVEGVNPTLAARLHQEGGPRPFTLSLLEPMDAGRQQNALKEGSSARLRLTFLQEEVFASLADAIWRLPPETSLPLGTALVTSPRLATTPAQSHWAAYTSFQELLEDAGQERTLRLAFLTPTTFRSRGQRNILFPEPSLVFGSLLARWNAYAPSPLNLTLAEAAAPALRLCGYRLATRMLDFGSYQELGFRGQAAYECSGHLPEDEVRTLNALASFAYFSGVGAKTTMGMGQCRRIKDARPLSHRARLHLEEGGGPAPGN